MEENNKITKENKMKFTKKDRNIEYKKKKQRLTFRNSQKKQQYD